MGSSNHPTTGLEKRRHFGFARSTLTSLRWVALGLAVMIVIGVILAVGSATASSPEDPEASVGGSVSGTVLGAPLNTPAVGVEIRVFDQNNSLYDVAETGVDGTYSTVALPTGTYFALTYNWSGFLDELYSDLPCYSGCDPSGGNPISIDGSSVSDIDFLLDPGGRITGFVVDQLDDPVTGAEVKIFDQTGAVRAWSTSSADGGFATDTSRAPGRSCRACRSHPPPARQALRHAHPECATKDPFQPPLTSRRRLLPI